MVDFLLIKDLLPQSQHDPHAMVMTGRYGKRFLPLTEMVPKPIGERPSLELIIRQLRRAGIHDARRQPDQITCRTRFLEHFGIGKHFGARLNYSREENPLGTAGGLRPYAMSTRPLSGD